MCLTILEYSLEFTFKCFTYFMCHEIYIILIIAEFTRIFTTRIATMIPDLSLASFSNLHTFLTQEHKHIFTQYNENTTNLKN